MNKLPYTIKTFWGEALEFEIELYSKETVGELRKRVAQAIIKLSEGWIKLEQIYQNLEKLPEGTSPWEEKQLMEKYITQYYQPLDQWDLANRKLQVFCDQLVHLGFIDCVFITDGKKTRPCDEGIGCLVCPSKSSYWKPIEFEDFISMTDKEKDELSI